MTDAEPVPPMTATALATLVASHRELLAFVERRVGDRALAEEILQDSLVKSLGRVGYAWNSRLVCEAASIVQRKRRSSR